MSTIQELMARPYSIIQNEKKIIMLELGLTVSIDSGFDKAMETLREKKEVYFQEMISQGALHLIPQPYLWRKKVFPIEGYEVKKNCIKAAIYSLFFLISVSIAALMINNVLKKNLLKLEKVVEPVLTSEEKKITIFKKNLEKYRPYIAEFSKVMEEEKKKVKSP